MNYCFSDEGGVQRDERSAIHMLHSLDSYFLNNHNNDIPYFLLNPFLLM